MIIGLALLAAALYCLVSAFVYGFTNHDDEGTESGSCEGDA